MAGEVAGEMAGEMAGTTAGEMAGEVVMNCSFPQVGELLINEVMINPVGDENTREFIELVNVSNEAINLAQNQLLYLYDYL